MTQPKAIPNDHQMKTTQNNPETVTSQPHKQPLGEQTKLSGLTDLIDKSIEPVTNVEAMNLKNTNQTKALEAAIEDPLLELTIASETTTDYEILLQIAKSALTASEASMKTTIDAQILAQFAMIAPPLTIEKVIVKKQYFMESSDNDLGETFADEPEAIVGGSPASPGEFPWQVSLNVDNQHICGGSIIGPYKILTAAHCVVGIIKPPYNNFYIVSGSIDNTKGQFNRVQSVRVHPSYKDSVEYAWVNDVAVITLATPIQYNQYQSPIDLADSQPAPGTQCTLSGWGVTSVNGRVPRYLLKMIQSVVLLSQCEQRHYGMPLTNSHLCAYNRRGIGACSGDSGGPLVANGKQIGLASWVLPCAEVHVNASKEYAIAMLGGMHLQQLYPRFTETFADEPEAIVGGTPASPGEFPWQVSLHYYGGHVCGGSIIAPTKILTAAHCVDFIKSPNDLVVRTGSIDNTGGQSNRVQSIRIHPSYTGQQRDAWQYDCAVITLTAPIQYNQYQSSIALADSQPASGTTCTLSGWGKTSANGPTSRTLLKMNQSVISLSQCQQRHYGMPLNNSHLCAYNRRGIGACQFVNRENMLLSRCMQLRQWHPEAIVGGSPASPGEFPWQVSLNLNNQHMCGGSIIGPNKILTAAHCVHGIIRAPYSNFRIRAGSINPSTGQDYRVQNVREHPNYSDDQRQAWVNDIAIITSFHCQLETSIQYNQYQSPIALADSLPAPGTLTTLSGWGLTSASGPAARTLLKMNQSIISLSQCQQSHYGMPLTSSHLCAYNRRGIGACMGDSGGPLVANGKQVGVVSWSSPCAVGVPDVYTSVPHHRSFIASS